MGYLPEGAADDTPAVARAHALKLAGHSAKKFVDAEQARAASMRFASEQGASLREISDATGVPKDTVARILERHRDE